MRSQLLHRPRLGGGVVEVARRSGGIQAQEQRAGRLQFRSRHPTLTAADVDRARTEERSLLRAWLMRETIHLVPAEDAGWMQPLFAAPMVRGSRRRLAELGLDAAAQERALRALAAMVERDGPATRTELAERLERRGFALGVEAKYHLWRLATLTAGVCLGPDRGRESCLVAAADWLDELRPRPREDALAEIARRYLGAFAPASEHDFSYWSGLPLRDCRAGLARIAGELAEPRGPGRLLALRRSPPRPGRRPLVRLLGGFDTYLLGYRSREHAITPERSAELLPGGGVLRATICLDGRLAGTWRSRRSGRRLEVSLRWFDGEPGGELLAAVRSEVEDVGRFECLAARLA